MIKLYHGSNITIDQIDLSIGRKGKDFGQGFYLSPDLKQAQRMAQSSSSTLRSSIFLGPSVPSNYCRNNDGAGTT